MRELGFYQKELDRLVNVEGTIEAAQRKQGEMEALLAGREPARLNTADREQYDNLVNELNDILRKMELEKIINRYNDLDSALTSEAAMDHELERINEIIEYREQAEQNPGTLENRSILLTVPEGQAVINETVEEARAVLILRDNRPPIYEGSGLAASKQVATLRSILNSGRDLTPRQRSTIQGMIRAFDNIITNEYDYDQRSQREQGGEETVTEQEVEVVRKDHINDRIEEQKKQKRIAEIVIEMTKIKAEIDSQEYDNYTEEQKRELEDRRYKLQVEGAELNGVDSSKFNGPYYDFKWPRLSDEQRAQNDQERARITEENQEAIDYADDVIPVLTQLQQLENVPGIEFEAIYAQEVDRMLDDYRRQLTELEQSQRSDEPREPGEFDNLSDEELENLVQQLESEVDEEWQFRVWEQNGLEENENDNDVIGRLAKLQKELARRKQEQTQEQGQKGKYDSMSIEDIENRIQELEEQIQEEWQFRTQEQNGIEQNDDDTLDKLTKEQKELKEELEKRKIIEKYKGKSDEDLKNRLSEIDEEINEEWQFRAHEQNGLEQNDDDTLDKLLREKKEIEEELKRREKERENENGKDNSREIKRLKNIIKELEGLEREKTKIITKEKKKTKHPKPKPIPGNDRGIDPPGPPGNDVDYGIYTEENQRKLDLVAQTEDKHIGTWDTIMRRNSKLPIFSKFTVGPAIAGIGAGLGFAALMAGTPAVWLAAPAVVAAGVAPMAVSAAMKAVGGLHSLVRGTFAKEKAMREKIDGMEREDFDLLVDNMLENGDIANEKYGEVYLECIRDRLGREVAADNKQVKEQMSPDIRRLAEALERGETLSIADRSKFANEWQAITDNNARYTEFDNAIKAKSHQRMNTRGRIFGTFNGDRTEFNKESARLHQAIRDAKTQEEADKAAQAYEEYRAEQVNTKKVPRIFVWMVGDNKADKGLINDAQQVQILDKEVRDYKEDKREPQFMKFMARMVHGAMAGIVASMPAIAKVHAQQQEAAANAQIASDNAVNQAANQTNQAAMQEISKIEKELRGAPSDKAVDDYVKMMINDKFLTSHNGEFVREQLGKFNHGGSDLLAHQEVENLTAQFLQQATRQQKIDFLRQTVIPSYKQTLTTELGDAQVWSYLKAKPQYIEDAVKANATDALRSDLDSMAKVVETGSKAADDLSKLGLQAYTDVGNVVFSALQTQVPTIMATASNLASHVRETLHIEPKVKVKDKKPKQHEERRIPEEQQPQNEEQQPRNEEQQPQTEGQQPRTEEGSER